MTVRRLARLLRRAPINPCEADRFPTRVRPALAARPFQTEFVQVVSSDLFAWSDLSERVEKDPLLQIQGLGSFTDSESQRTGGDNAEPC